MKLFFKTTLVGCFCASLALSSCKDDDYPYSNSLTGNNFSTANAIAGTYFRIATFDSVIVTDSSGTSRTKTNYQAKDKYTKILTLDILGNYEQYIVIGSQSATIAGYYQIVNYKAFDFYLKELYLFFKQESNKTHITRTKISTRTEANKTTTTDTYEIYEKN